MADLDHRKLLSVVEANWQAKMEACHAYAALDKNESDPYRRNALRSLAVAEKHLTGLWFGRILALGRAEPHSLPGQASFAVTWAGPAAFDDLVATARKFNLEQRVAVLLAGVISGENKSGLAQEYASLNELCIPISRHRSTSLSIKGGR